MTLDCTDDDLHDRVVALLGEILQVDFSASPGDVRRDAVSAWDSIAHLRLITDLEDTFGVMIDDDVGLSLSSTRQIVEMLRARDPR